MSTSISAGQRWKPKRSPAQRKLYIWYCPTGPILRHLHSLSHTLVSLSLSLTLYLSHSLSHLAKLLRHFFSCPQRIHLRPSKSLFTSVRNDERRGAVLFGRVERDQSFFSFFAFFYSNCQKWRKPPHPKEDPKVTPGPFPRVKNRKLPDLSRSKHNRVDDVRRDSGIDVVIF
jgi:hypothetical protein